MAFFNLWSSERLSFSLSIVAVISAAITTYHQFSHTTEVSFFENTFNVSAPPGFLQNGSYRDSLSGSLTFMNSGSTPVSIISSSVILHADTAIIQREIDENPYVALYPITHNLNSKSNSFESDFYLEENSVSKYRFVTAIDSVVLKELVNKAVPLDFDTTAALNSVP